MQELCRSRPTSNRRQIPKETPFTVGPLNVVDQSCNRAEIHYCRIKKPAQELCLSLHGLSSQFLRVLLFQRTSRFHRQSWSIGRLYRSTPILRSVSSEFHELRHSMLTRLGECCRKRFCCSRILACGAAKVDAPFCADVYFDSTSNRLYL